jgi:hypothetical protein
MPGQTADLVFAFAITGFSLCFVDKDGDLYHLLLLLLLI